MSYFLTFALIFGGVLGLSAVVAAIVIRSADVGLAWKLILPAAILGLGLYSPFAVDAMLGRPIATTFAALPERAELVAYVPHDEAGLVDLWLMDGGPVPRSYEIALDPRIRMTLRQASEQLARGVPVTLRKARASDERAAVSRAAAPTGIRNAFDPGYVIDESASPRLPSKD